MTVKKRIITTVNEKLNILEATLLSVEEAKSLLTEEELVYKNWWWLRTPGFTKHEAAVVSSYGNICEGSYCIDNLSIPIRPALILSDISNTAFKVGDVFEIGEYRFKIISPTLAWMFEQDIGYHCFDKHTNVYEKSHVKTVVNNWFDILMKEGVR